MLFKYFWKPIFWIVVVAVLSLIPANDLPDPKYFIPHFDKIVHAGMYFTICIFSILPFQKVILGNAYVVSVISSTLLGGLFEILQSMMGKNRSGNIADLIADFAGALLAIVFFHYFVRNKKLQIIFKAG